MRYLLLLFVLSCTREPKPLKYYPYQRVEVMYNDYSRDTLKLHIHTVHRLTVTNDGRLTTFLNEKTFATDVKYYKLITK